MGFAVYIHIPFCEVKCGYCDFFSVPRGYEDFDLQAQYVEALAAEIHERAGEFGGRRADSLFFGGGTPSLLEPKLLEKVFSALARHFSWGAETEITLETNPKTVSRQKLAAFRSLGVNRVSIGVQSFQDRFLKILGRIHDGAEARKTVADAREAGFENVSCDLIFALPGQTFEDWKSDLETALNLGTDHLSAYHLTIESGTPFEALFRQGRLNLPAEETGVSMLQWTRERMAGAGLEAYEISNFARPGRESVHNSNYWRYGEYLGFGAGAVGCVRSPEPGAFNLRRHNARHLKPYLDGDRGETVDRIGKETAMGEFCMLGLRMREGIEDGRFAAIFGTGLEAQFSRPLKAAERKGWLSREKDRWRLTPEGLLFADEVAASFF